MAEVVPARVDAGGEVVSPPAFCPFPTFYGGGVARRRIDPANGIAAVRSWELEEATPGELRTAVRYTLELLAEIAPGGSVEVRVPPAGVVQVIEGPRHTRGTPPNTIETDMGTWLELVTGRLDWAEALAGGRVDASGQRADLSPLLPLRIPTA